MHIGASRRASLLSIILKLETADQVDPSKISYQGKMREACQCTLFQQQIMLVLF
jgi:hypothetical protein